MSMLSNPHASTRIGMQDAQYAKDKTLKRARKESDARVLQILKRKHFQTTTDADLPEDPDAPALREALTLLRDQVEAAEAAETAAWRAGTHEDWRTEHNEPVGLKYPSICNMLSHRAPSANYRELCEINAFNATIVQLGAHTGSVLLRATNKETATLNYAIENLNSVMHFVPRTIRGHNCARTLTGMQRLCIGLASCGISTPLKVQIRKMATGRDGASRSQQQVYRDEADSKRADMRYMLKAHDAPSTYFLNLMPGSWKTVIALSIALRTVCSPSTFKRAQIAWRQQHNAPRINRHSNIYEEHATENHELVPIVIVYVPEHLFSQWSKEISHVLESYSREYHSYINCWEGTYGKKRSLEVAKTLYDKERKPTLWLLSQKKGVACDTLCTHPHLSAAVVIFDEKINGFAQTRSRQAKTRSLIRQVLVLQATTESLCNATSNKNAITSIFGESGLMLNSEKHMAIMTLATPPNWLRTQIALSLQDKMPPGFRFFYASVIGETLASRVSGQSILVSTSPRDLVNNLLGSIGSPALLKQHTASMLGAFATGEPLVEQIASATARLQELNKPMVLEMDALDKQLIEARHTLARERLRPNESVSEAHKAECEKVCAELPERLTRVREQVSANGIARRAYEHIKAAVIEGPPPTCLIDWEPIPPEKRCVLTCCYAIYNRDSLFGNGTTPTIKRCANCRHPIGEKGTGVLLEKDVREQMRDIEETTAEANAAAKASAALALAPSALAKSVGERVEQALRASEGAEMKVAEKVEHLLATIAPLHASRGGMRVLLALKYNECSRGPVLLMHSLKKISGVDSVSTVTNEKGVADYQSRDKVNRVLVMNIGLSKHTEKLEGLDLQGTQLTIAHDCSETEHKLVQLIGRSLRVSSSEEERPLPKFFYSLTTK